MLHLEAPQCFKHFADIRFLAWRDFFVQRCHCHVKSKPGLLIKIGGIDKVKLPLRRICPDGIEQFCKSHIDFWKRQRAALVGHRDLIGPLHDAMLGPSGEFIECQRNKEVFVHYVYYTVLRGFFPVRHPKKAHHTLPKCLTIHAMTPAQFQALDLIRGIAPSYAHDKDAAAWDFKDFLTTLAHQYHTDVSTYSSIEGLDGLVKEFEMSIVPIYDHPHDSDESSSVEMLLIKGVPLAGWLRVGDRNDYSDGLRVFNDALGREIAFRVWQLANADTGPVGQDDLDVLAWMFEGNHYLHPIKDLREDPIAYVLQNPRWMLGRIDTNDNALYVVNEDNTLVRVSRITKTATSGDPYGSDAYHRTTVDLVDGTSREVDSGYLVHTPLRAPKIA